MWMIGWSRCPAPTSRLWRRVEARGLDREGLQKFAEGALRARAEEFRVCRFCKEEVAPEHCHDEDVCHGCAEKHLRVVH